MVRLTIGKCGRKARRDLREFESKLATFNEAMKRFESRTSRRNDQLVAQTKAIVVETRADVKTGNKKLDELSEVFQKLALMLDKRLADPEYVQNLREGGGTKFSSGLYELKEALEDLRRGSAKQKREAQRDLVRIALAFVRDGNEHAVETGLTTLDKLIGDANARSLVMKNPSVVRTLLSREAEQPGDKFVW